MLRQLQIAAPNRRECLGRRHRSDIDAGAQSRGASDAVRIDVAIEAFRQ